MTTSDRVAILLAMPEFRPLARTTGLRAEETDDGLLIYSEQGELLLSLNRSAAVVWQNSDGSRTLEDLVEVLTHELGQEADEHQVLVALDELQKNGLIESGYEQRDPDAARLSRRQFVRRVGVVAAVAVGIPVVHSMAAPKPAAGGTLGHYKYQPKKHKKVYLGLSH